ncbi:MAG: hypothetical protein HOW73_29970 [Polyangiaceae bacterium]|nr:hypothetical protein [Polyangiaceae bacterium]
MRPNQRSLPLKSLPIRKILAFTIAGSLALIAAAADAAGKKDKEVQKLFNQAMDEDYLNVEFDKAESKLKKAADTCAKEKDACSPELAAKVHVGLATVHGVGQQKLDVAKADLVTALKTDPKAALLEGLSTPELEAKFKEAKAEVGGGGTGGAEPTGGTGEGGKGGETGTAVASDFPHEPTKEQAVNTPVPVFAEIGEDLGATKVIVRYKPYGATKWETLALEKMEGGFGGLIPCDAVTSGGELKYFIIASDESGTPIATAGSMKAPFKVLIKQKISGDKPSLPGKDPPKKCAAKADCPPGLPGCGGDGGGKPIDAICDATPECSKGLVCLNGVCAPGEGNDGPETPSGGTHHVISVGAQFDIAYVADGEDVCSSSSSASYVCMYPDSDPSAQFFGVPDAVNGTNGISGGLAFGGARILAGYDYFFDFGLGLGARVGYAFGGPYPCEPGVDGCPARPDESSTPAGNSFFPAHLEGRVSWKFLKPNPEAGDFAPHVFVGFGGGQVNASVPVTVCDKLVAEGEEPDANCTDNGTGAGVQRKVDAYQLAGLTFATFGGGVTYMFVKNFGISGELKFMVLFPTVGFTISPVIAPVVAF